MDFLNDKSVQKFLLIVVVLVLLFWYKNTHVNEGFAQSLSKLETSEPQNEIVIRPPIHNAAGTVMSGSDFQGYPSENDVRNLMVRDIDTSSGDIPVNRVIPAWSAEIDGKIGIPHDLDDGEGGSLGLHYNLCSKSCCSDQYPTPFKMPHDLACDNKDKYVPNNYSCNNSWQDSGCVCMTERQANFISNRGSNA
jgi:hypothetical protein